VRVAEAADGGEMSRAPEVEDFDRAVVFGGEEQAVAIEVGGEVVEVAGCSRGGRRSG
jgi:hypothetical protein